MFISNSLKTSVKYVLYILDSFLAKHTSEDNASYEKVIALENKKRAAKLASQFEAEVKSAICSDAALALPSIEEQADQRERPHEVCGIILQNKKKYG